MDREEALEKSRQYYLSLLKIRDDGWDVDLAGFGENWDYLVSVLPFMSEMLDNITEWNNDLSNSCQGIFQDCDSLFAEFIEFKEGFRKI